MTRIRGMCEGGPFHGQWLYESGEVYRVAVRDGKIVTYVGPATPEIEIHEYHHDQGTWHWKGPEIPVRKSG